MTIYDVLRYLIRQSGHASGNAERDLLLAVDAAEQGYPDLESYKEQLAQKEREDRAAAAAEAGTPAPAAGSPAELSDSELEAEIERRKALKAAKDTPNKAAGLTRAPKKTS